MIQLHQVRKSYRNQQQLLPILDIPHWHVAQGDRIALLGPSGSGKSTLLYLLCGVLAPDEGTCKVGNEPLHQMTELERDHFRAKHVGIIFQDFHLISSLSAKQNIELVYDGSLHGRERHSHILQWFERVGLQDRMNHLPGQLSRGQQQRVAIIRALINRPSLLLADEPTGSLDYDTAQYTMNLLLQLAQEEGSTLLTVTHDQHLASQYPMQLHISAINRLAVHPYPAEKSIMNSMRLMEGAAT
ncbi:ABC transporter ATP-binding protein [Paenibacillaceae sp. P-4]|uniref:ABC transporter ATP-binding protein n=1 Tax=Paenibacillaceae bacterium P-4 TaxID=3160969 RepID=UPI0032E82D06